MRILNRCAGHVAAIIPKRTMCEDCSRPRVDRLYADGGRRRPATSGRSVSGPRRSVDGHARRRRVAFPRRPTTYAYRPQLNRGARATPRRDATVSPTAAATDTATRPPAKRTTILPTLSHAEPKVAPVSPCRVDRYFTFAAALSDRACTFFHCKLYSELRGWVCSGAM